MVGDDRFSCCLILEKGQASLLLAAVIQAEGSGHGRLSVPDRKEAQIVHPGGQQGA